jgi:hypothetical protein
MRLKMKKIYKYKKILDIIQTGCEPIPVFELIKSKAPSKLTAKTNPHKQNTAFSHSKQTVFPSSHRVH